MTPFTAVRASLLRLSFVRTRVWIPYIEIVGRRDTPDDNHVLARLCRDRLGHLFEHIAWRNKLQFLAAAHADIPLDPGNEATDSWACSSNRLHRQ